jgi:hypothetical protein
MVDEKEDKKPDPYEPKHAKPADKNPTEEIPAVKPWDKK